MAANKNDFAARVRWGEVYDKTPKSVFAVVAWHLANIASDEPDAPGAAEARFVEELRALMDNYLLPAEQAKAVLRAFATAEGQS